VRCRQVSLHLIYASTHMALKFIRNFRWITIVGPIFHHPLHHCHSRSNRAGRRARSARPVREQRAVRAYYCPRARRPGRRRMHGRSRCLVGPLVLSPSRTSPHPHASVFLGLVVAEHITELAPVQCLFRPRPRRCRARIRTSR
jgi:hypothetical protein